MLKLVAEPKQALTGVQSKAPSISSLFSASTRINPSTPNVDDAVGEADGALVGEEDGLSVGKGVGFFVIKSVGGGVGIATGVTGA